jgi:hypothetical protein
VRLSDAEREALLERLKRHAATGALDVSELERRVELVIGAQTREEAAAALADLPPAEPAPSAGRRRRGRGHGEADAPAPEWQPTAERFRDPRSGQVMRVWVDSAGGRHYVAEPPD